MFLYFSNIYIYLYICFETHSYEGSEAERVETAKLTLKITLWLEKGSTKTKFTHASSVRGHWGLKKAHSASKMLF